MQDDIKPPTQENPSSLPSADSSEVRTPPPTETNAAAPPTESTPPPESSPDLPPATAAETKPSGFPEPKNEHHLVPILLAAIILGLLAAIAIASGSR